MYIQEEVLIEPIVDEMDRQSVDLDGEKFVGEVVDEIELDDELEPDEAFESEHDYSSPS